jgi:DNA-binding CsgD family transcriptional regulator
MAQALTLQELVSAFGGKDTPQEAAEAFFEALRPLDPISVVLVDAHERKRDVLEWDEPARAMSPEFWARREEVAQADVMFPLTVATRRMRRPFRWTEMGPDYFDLATQKKHWQLCYSLASTESDGVVVPRFHQGWLVAAICIGFKYWRWDKATEDTLIAAASAFVNRFSREPEFKSLSRRESECLLMVADGLSDAQIAAALQLSAKTVKDYVESARAKLSASNRVEAVARHLVANMAEARQGRRIPELSPREHVCLFRALYGATDDEIAAGLGIAASTVHGHIESAKVKLGARTRAQAIAELARRGGL